MGDFLDELAAVAWKNVKEGYYRHSGASRPCGRRSLRNAIVALGGRKAPIISEIKFASPSAGLLRAPGNIEFIARSMVKAGAVGLSILTEPYYFSGSLENLLRARMVVETPILMKDIVVSMEQIETAWKMDADAILLIVALFERGYCEASLNEVIEYSHAHGLEVLLEAHTPEEFKLALSTDADMIGINNRDLKTLKVDLSVTKRILKSFDKSEAGGRPIISESGIRSPGDIRFLRKCGADAFLVGSSIMTAKSIIKFISGLVNAYGESES
ncbi:MAG: indole-3-glycerol-phosphate synthase [Candidatus Bathyarchaeia archaeon]